MMLMMNDELMSMRRRAMIIHDSLLMIVDSFG